MPSVVLSTGLVLELSVVERVEFYPEHSLDGYGCVFGGPEMRACPYLFVQTNETTARIDGAAAERDALLLEYSGVHVIRHPIAGRVAGA
jgi:hypothetical protein